MGSKKTTKKKPAKEAKTTVAVQRGLATYLPRVGDDPKGRAEVLVPLASLTNIPTKGQLREPEKMPGLCDSIRSEGLYNAIIVRPTGDNGSYRIVQGRHRAYAHKALGLEEIPAVVREDLDDQAEAVATGIENLQRVNLSPYEEGLAYQAAVATGLTQKEVAERVGVTAQTVSGRLGIVGLGEELGPLVGDLLTVEHGEWLKPLADHPELAGQVAAFIRSESEDKHSMPSVSWMVDHALTSGKNAKLVNPDDQHEFLHSIKGVDYGNSYRIRQDDQYWKDVLELDGLHFGPKEDPDLVLVFDKKKAKEAAERAKQRVEKAQRNRSSSSSSRSTKTDAQLRKERIEREARVYSVELVAKHLKSRTSFNDELVKHAYRAFLDSAGQIAPAKTDQAAFEVILGDHADDWSLDRPDGDIVDALWDKDRLTLDRYVAACVWFHGRQSYSFMDDGRQWLIDDNDTSRYLCGKTAGQIQAVVKQRVDAKHAKKPAKKKATKRTRKAKAAKKTDPKGKECPGCLTVLNADGSCSFCEADEEA